MSASLFEHSAAARRALRVIVTDPAYGPAALESTQMVANMLQDLLPDAPRESSVLVAAASAGMPAKLRSHAAQGLMPAAAIRLAAAALESRTAYPPETCEWAAREYAIALGIDAAEAAPSPGGYPATELVGSPPVAPRRP